MKKFNEKEVAFINEVSGKIAYKSLLKLASKGNMIALEKLNMNNNSTYSMEDLKQDISVEIIENIYNGNIELQPTNNTYELVGNDEVIKALWGIVARVLYSMQQRHYKNQYIEIDNEIINISSVKELSTVACIEDIIESEFYNELLKNAYKAFPKYKERIKKIIPLRICGYTLHEISTITNYTQKQIRKTIEKVGMIYKLM